MSASADRTAVIASGSARYADPWHPFAQTSARISRVLQDAGFRVTVDNDVDRAVTHLDDVDLLVVNAGDPWRNTTGADSRTTPDVDAFARAVDRGIGVLAMHCAVASLRDYPGWAPAIGAMWVPGSSHHPPIGTTRVRVEQTEASSAGSFDVMDERYCRLQRLGRSQVVARHDGDERDEPSAWIRQVGRSRVAVDVLGHDERSFESAEHCEMIVHLARWVTAVAGR